MDEQDYIPLNLPEPSDYGGVVDNTPSDVYEDLRPMPKIPSDPVQPAPYRDQTPIDFGNVSSSPVPTPFGASSLGAVYAASVEVVDISQAIKAYYNSVSYATGTGAGKPLFVAPANVTVKKVSVSYLINDSTGSASDEIELDFGTINTSNGQLQNDGFSISWSPQSSAGVSSAGSSLAGVSQGDAFGVGFLSGNSTSLANSAYKGLAVTVFFEDA